MDNTDSEMIESLNLLRPPVRRDYKVSRFGYNPNAVNFMTEWRKPKRRVKGGRRIRRSVESSTSLILKRTSDSQIFNRNPVVSYTSIQHQREITRDVKCGERVKPLIKVIVVPNDQPSEGKQTEVTNCHRICLKHSEDDNAIETKNVYLVVTGRKKDKIYEIKTTESPTLSATELKDDTVNKIFNGDCFRQLIKALIMEKKKNNILTNKETEIDHVCKCAGCSVNNEEPVQEIDDGRSKVKIFGQLGLTEDDRYVFKCSATVNDQPVSTIFSTVGQKAPDDSSPPDAVQGQITPCKDHNIQETEYPQRKHIASQAKIESTIYSTVSPRMTREFFQRKSCPPRKLFELSPQNCYPSCKPCDLPNPCPPRKPCELPPPCPPRKPCELPPSCQPRKPCELPPSCQPRKPCELPPPCPPRKPCELPPPCQPRKPCEVPPCQPRKPCELPPPCQPRKPCEVPPCQPRKPCELPPPCQPRKPCEVPPCQPRKPCELPPPCQPRKPCEVPPCQPRKPCELPPPNSCLPRKPCASPPPNGCPQRKPCELPPPNSCFPRKPCELPPPCQPRKPCELRPSNSCLPRKPCASPPPNGCPQRKPCELPPPNSCFPRKPCELPPPCQPRKPCESRPSNSCFPRKPCELPPPNCCPPRKQCELRRSSNSCFPRKPSESPPPNPCPSRKPCGLPPPSSYFPRKPCESPPPNCCPPRKPCELPPPNCCPTRKPCELPPPNSYCPRKPCASPPPSPCPTRKPCELPPPCSRRTQVSQCRPNDFIIASEYPRNRAQQTQTRLSDIQLKIEYPKRRNQQTQRRSDEYMSITEIVPYRMSEEYQQTSETIQRINQTPFRRTMSKECPKCNEICRPCPHSTQCAHRTCRYQSRQSSTRAPVERIYSFESQEAQVNYRNNSFDYAIMSPGRPCTRETSFDQMPCPATIDNNTQCTCNCGDKRNPSKLTETQSPLVVISVYPNSDVECDQVTLSNDNLYDSPNFGSLQEQSNSNPRQSKLDRATQGTVIGTALRDTLLQQDLTRNKTFIHKSYRKPSRSPTPQNVKNKNVSDQNKVIETRVVKTNTRGQSPSKSPHTNKIPVRSNACRTIKKQESKKTIASKQKNTTTRNMQISKNKCKSRAKDKSGSGNQFKSKSFIFDKYKKAINERVDKYNSTSPKHEVSAVSINIESENECYDVSFHQGEYTTDVIVHKKTKNYEKLNDSTVNFFAGSRNPIFSNEYPTYAVSISETDNYPDNDVHIGDIKSKLKPRDSLEISHRHNPRTEIETQTRIEVNDSVSKEDMHYFAPVKHYTGDNCVICDPLVRDKEIQQLLGVSRRVISSQTNDVKKDIFGTRKFVAQQCYNVSDERERKDMLYSEVGFMDSLCSSCCLRRSCCESQPPPKNKKSKSSLKKFMKRAASEKHRVVLESRSSCNNYYPPEPNKPQSKPEKPKPISKPQPQKIAQKVEHKTLYQQLVLNRNVHIFLQVEEFSKQKPICLTKQQYDKVKKTIQSTISRNKSVPLYKKWGKKVDVDCACVESLVSIGEVRQKIDKEVRQEIRQPRKIKHEKIKQERNKHEKHKREKEKQGKHKKGKHEQQCSIAESLSAEFLNASSNSSIEKKSEGRKSWQKLKAITKDEIRRRFGKQKNEKKVETVILYSRESRDLKHPELANFKIEARRTMSSLEVRYASVSYLKHITFSSAEAFEPFFEPLASESSFALKDPISIETLFKGHKKSPTPNLGTSTLSIISEPLSHSASLKLFEKPNQSKRPFLKRLMSCLVMRSDKTPMPTLMPPKNPPTVDSSFDSYHFSTSLGALDMSSSMYDTSASFFSNHSVYPKSNKLKRSFLNSMRGFLSNKRS